MQPLLYCSTSLVHHHRLTFSFASKRSSLGAAFCEFISHFVVPFSHRNYSFALTDASKTCCLRWAITEDAINEIPFWHTPPFSGSCTQNALANAAGTANEANGGTDRTDVQRTRWAVSSQLYLIRYAAAVYGCWRRSRGWMEGDDYSYTDCRLLSE